MSVSYMKSSQMVAWDWNRKRENTPRRRNIHLCLTSRKQTGWSQGNHPWFLPLWILRCNQPHPLCVLSVSKITRALVLSATRDLSNDWSWRWECCNFCVVCERASEPWQTSTHFCGYRYVASIYVDTKAPTHPPSPLPFCRCCANIVWAVRRGSICLVCSRYSQVNGREMCFINTEEEGAFW